MKSLPIVVRSLLIILLCSAGCKDNNSVNPSSNQPVGVPATPTSLNATAVSSSQIDLSWTDASTNETGFRVERAPGGTTSFTEITTVGANVTTYQNTSLSASTSYSYRIRAYNTAGNSGYSNTDTAMTQAAAATAPSAPTNLNATAASSTQVNLSWTDNANNETGFRIERAPGGTTSFVEIGTVGANVTSYQNTGLTASTNYGYRVRAYNTAGNSGYSNTDTAMTQAPPLPSGPAISAPTTSTGSFSVTLTYSWPSLGSSQDRYELEQSTTSSSSGFTLIHTSTLGSHTSPYSIPLTKTAGTYYFRARAYVGTGPSPGYTSYSSVVTVVVSSQVTTQTYYASYDNLLMNNSTNTAVANTVYSNSELAVGTDFFYTIVGTFNYIQTASVMRFDVQSAISGKSILEAKLRFYQRILPGDFAGRFRLAAIATNWSPSTITWNTFMSMNYWTDYVFNFQALATTVVPFEFDVTAIVQTWANGTRTNYGFQIWEPSPSAPGYESYQAPSIQSLEVYNATNQRPQLYLRYQ